MRSVILLAVLLVSLAACQPQAAPTPSPSDAATSAPGDVAAEASPAGPDCTAKATRAWMPSGDRAGGGLTFTIEASSSGPTCDEAVATLTLRDNDGEPDFTADTQANDVPSLSGPDTAADMAAALRDWIAGEEDDITSALPDWPDDAPAPDASDGAFDPAAGIDRNDYTSVREQGYPLFCFATQPGRRCIYWDGQTFQDIGLRHPPA